MLTLCKPALILFALLSLITGVAYPLAVFGVAQVAFSRPANGSLVVRDGKPVGSALIGQAFVAPGYFHGRPSATSLVPYNAMASGGSNLGPRNPALLAAVQQRLATMRAANPDAPGPVPAELVMASASGLDPDVSPEAAAWQAPRVAHARGVTLAQVRTLIAQHTRPPALGMFGEPCVNVLALNLALDAAARQTGDNARK